MGQYHGNFCQEMGKGEKEERVINYIKSTYQDLAFSIN